VESNVGYNTKQNLRTRCSFPWDNVVGSRSCCPLSSPLDVHLHSFLFTFKAGSCQWSDGVSMVR